MLSYVHGPDVTPLLEHTIGECLDRAAARFGDHDALISCHQNIRYSYSGLLHHVNRAARALLRLGVERGDRVGIWGPNSAEWMISQYAAAKVGAILVNVNPSYRLRELEYVLNQSGIKVLIAARGFKKIDYVELLATLMTELNTARSSAPVAERCPLLRHLIYLGAESSPGGMSWTEFVEQGEAVDESALSARERVLNVDDPANIQYTSGTTGSPKGATLSHRNIVNNAFFVGAMLKYSPADRICVPVPFYHCFGCVMGNLGALTHGAAVVVPAESFEPEATPRAIEMHRCTSVYGVPTMFIAQLGHPAFNQVRLDSLRTGVMAGAPCPIEVMKQVMDRMHVPEITICYGMTETSPVSLQSAVDDSDRGARFDGWSDSSARGMQHHQSRERRDCAAGDRG
ncbi:MAG TPA: AMP-binding protein [Vicinamibacterales bacterium]|nr:AMP-binding protein [Vicinamibacterales bacterium]